MVKFFTKPIFALFSAVAILFASCQTQDTADIVSIDVPEYSIGDQYENSILLPSGKGETDVVTTEIKVKDIDYLVHSIVISDNEVKSWIEYSYGIDPNHMISTIDLKTGDFTYIQTSLTGKGRCRQGASNTVAAGGTLASAGLLGCVPCAFVGGAIAGVGSALYLLCSLT